MKIQALETDVPLRFKLKDFELDAVAEDVRMYSNLARENKYDEDYLIMSKLKKIDFKEFKKVMQKIEKEITKNKHKLNGGKK